MILFHHRAFRMRTSECGVWSSKRERRSLVRAPPFRTLHSALRTGNGCLAWIRTKTVGVKARHAAVTPRGNGLVEPEVVATSPNRIKRPVPVFCGFGSLKLVLAAGFAPALATLSTSCLFCWTTRALEMEPPAGAAPARFSYKEDPQAAAWRRNGLPSCSARREGWSQPPVLPWARRAYETCLSAGSTAILADGHPIKMEPPPGIAPSYLQHQWSPSLRML